MKPDQNEPYYLQGLNERQKKAVLTINGPLLILAGAGAGKTKTVTHRILHLIKEGARPNSILAITFTNKAASEMRERVSHLLKEDTLLNQPVSMDEMPFVSTFHSLGVRIIKENSSVLGLPRHFSILDRGDSKTAIKNSMEAVGVNPKNFEPSKVLNFISRQKGDGISIEDFATKGPKGYFEETALKVWEEYEKTLAKEKALDFDDLLLKTLQLLRQDNVIERYWNLWRYIHIDEYQDTNRVQYDIAKRLAEKWKNIAVVGDIDQCLVAGTKITMADGSEKPIERIKPGDMVLSNYGSGDHRPARVTKVFSKNFSGDAIKITTASNKELISTPEHVHFAGFRLGLSGQRYFTYMMYKRGKGYRLGVSQVYTKGQKKPVVGFVQRCNHEHADKLWILKSFDNPNDARVLEYTLSLKHGIPTLPFVARKGGNINGMVHDQRIIDKIFSTCNSDESGIRILQEYGLSKNFPHHLPQSRNSIRRNLIITLCGDRRGKTTMHRISMIGNDKEGMSKLKSLGLSVRGAKIGSRSWRFETCNKDYGVLEKTVKLIKGVFVDLEIIRNARLGGNRNNKKDGNSLPFTHATSVVPGMVLFDGSGGYDEIVSVERISTDKTIHDLNIEQTHNFIANGITTHNSIYSWRGADFKNILRFEKDYPGTEEILLEENYRSTKTILAAANAVIAKNVMRKDKNLFTSKEDGDQISLYLAFDEKDEATYIANTSRMLIGQGVPASEIAVLYRANFQSRAIEEAFVHRNISYELIGTKFFERREVRDVISYIKAALNPDSLSDIKRIINTPARGIGKVTMLKILEGKEEELSGGVREKVMEWRRLLDLVKTKAGHEKPSDVVKFVIKQSGLESMLQADHEDGAERLENVRELATIASGYDEYPIGLEEGSGMEKFLEHVALSSDQDEVEKKGGVKLMTVHAAKGLEFDYVFIAGLEQDLFPHQRMSDEDMSKEDREEERRLFYVALTRARSKLYLSYAESRMIYGSRQVNVPSEFLKDIDDSLLQYENSAGRGYAMSYIDF